MGLLRKAFGEGDRSAEGVPGRAVCRWARCGLQPGQRATTTRTKVELLLADGSSATLAEALPWQLAVALCSWEDSDAPDWFDTDIPVRVDPATGEVLALDRPQLEHELADRVALIEQRWTLTAQVGKEIQDIKADVTGIKEAPGALRDAAKGVKEAWSEPVDDTPVIPESMQLAATDPSLAPIEGVTYELWVAVQGGMLRDKVKRKGRVAYADAQGVPAGQWDRISGEWMARTQQNPGLAIRMSQDIERIRRG